MLELFPLLLFSSPGQGLFELLSLQSIFPSVPTSLSNFCKTLYVPNKTFLSIEFSPELLPFELENVYLYNRDLVITTPPTLFGRSILKLVCIGVLMHVSRMFWFKTFSQWVMAVWIENCVEWRLFFWTLYYLSFNLWLLITSFLQSDHTNFYNFSGISWWQSLSMEDEVIYKFCLYW